MNAQYQRRIEHTRRRIDRNRRTLQRNGLRTVHCVQRTLDWRLQAERRPLPLLLGAAGAGMLASRVLSALDRRRVEAWLFELAASGVGGRAWKRLADKLIDWMEAGGEASDDEPDKPTNTNASQ